MGWGTEGCGAGWRGSGLQQYTDSGKRVSDIHNTIILIMEDTDVLEKSAGQSVEEKTEENGSSSFEMDLYTLQFRWIPSLIDAVMKGNIPCQALADVPWWKQCLTKQGMTKADFSFEEIKAEVKKISEEKRRICLTFPYPKRVPLAKYAVIDLVASGKINYYTLEMSLDDTWVLGSQDIHRHSYIRQVPDCQTMADFQREVDRPYDGISLQRILIGLLIILVFGILILLIVR